MMNLQVMMDPPYCCRRDTGAVAVRAVTVRAWGKIVGAVAPAVTVGAGEQIVGIVAVAVGEGEMIGWTATVSAVQSLF